MTDSGREFNLDEMRKIVSILNVQQRTSGESQLQNGLCERVHAITDMMLVKLKADYSRVNSQTLLSCANMERYGTVIAFTNWFSQKILTC